MAILCSSPHLDIRRSRLACKLHSQKKFGTKLEGRRTCRVLVFCGISLRASW